MNLGATTVTFVQVTETGAVDALGSPILAPTNVDVRGCHHRPLSAAETPEWLTDISTQIWETTAPPEAAAIAAASTGKLTVDGVTYQIVGGAQPFKDFTPNVYVVTILSKLVAS